jgi:hypothetical protein
MWTDIRKSRNMENMIKGLKYECLATDCPWIGNLDNYSIHLDECRSLYLCGCGLIVRKEDAQEHNESCTWYYIDCNMCGEKIVRTQKQNHLDNDCPNVDAACGQCHWTDKRSNLESHYSKCQVTLLKKELSQLKAQRQKRDNFEVIRHSDSFIVTGLLDIKDEERMNLVNKYYLSYTDHGFEKSYGSVDTNEITICNIQNDSVHKVEFLGRLTGYAKIDISKEEGVMIITLNGKHNRFIIFKSKTRKPEIEPKFERGIGTIKFKMFYNESQLLEPSLMVYAYRSFIWCKGKDKEYPFEIDIANRHYTEFTLMIKKELREELLKDIKNFFDIE